MNTRQQYRGEVVALADKLSEQNLVSCSSSYGNRGCNGGWYYDAWDYSKSHPLDTSFNYPYTSGNTGRSGTCDYDKSNGKVSATSYVRVSGNTSSIKSAVAVKPNSCSIDASSSTFRNYKSGIITGSSCGTRIDHAVVIVGYGTSSGTNYYLVRNSWGRSWGESGYVKIGQASGKGICGINQYVAYPKTD